MPGALDHRRIYELVDEFEAQRKKYLAWTVNLAIGSLLFFITFISLPFVTFSGTENFSDLSLVLAAVLGTVAFLPVSLLRLKFKEILIPKILDQYHLQYDFHANHPPPDEFMAMLPAFSDYEVSDHFFGRYNGININMAELQLRLGLPRWSTLVFSGLVGQFDMPKWVDGDVFVHSNAGSYGFGAGGLISSARRVRLEDPLFEDRFEVYSDDQVVARYILTPSMMERLIRLDHYHPGLRVRFIKNQVYLILPNAPDLFETKFFFSPIDPNIVEQFQRDIEMILDLVDTLKLGSKSKK